MGEKRIKNRGFTLVEVMVYISIFTMIFYISMAGIKSHKEKEIFRIEKIKISQFIRKIQQYSQYEKKVYILDFKISENKMYFINGNKKREILEERELSKEISYMTNNKEKNLDFVRETTEEGNFQRGFSVYLLNKKGNKIYYRISTNTINSAKYPIISIYRAKKPIYIEENYLDEKLWEEEI